MPGADQATRASEAVPCRGGNLHSVAQVPKLLSRRVAPCPIPLPPSPPVQCEQGDTVSAAALARTRRRRTAVSPWAPGRRGRTCFAQVYATCRQSPSRVLVPGVLASPQQQFFVLFFVFYLFCFFLLLFLLRSLEPWSLEGNLSQGQVAVPCSAQTA